MSEIVHVPFNGDDLPVVMVDGKPHIVLRPVIESLGLDYSGQLQKLKGKSWTCMGLASTQVGGQTREMVTVDVRTLLMLLAGVQEKRVSEAVRPKLVAYQSEVADVIEAYFTEGGAINPRATEDQLIGLANRIEAQARVLQAVRGIVDPRWLEAKARVLTARALGEAPEINHDDRPLTVSDFLEERGLKGEELRRAAPSFGKRLKAAHVVETGEEPMQTERLIDGAIRMVNAYTERHRSLFDQVFEAMFA